MADMEKVIKGLECHVGLQCNDCPYVDSIHPAYGCHLEELIADALALLEKQKAKAGTWQWKIHGKVENGGTLGEAICDQCGKSTYATAVKGDLNYCPNCGANMIDRR